MVSKLVGNELGALRGFWRLNIRAVETARWLLEVLGSSISLSWRLRELPNSRSIGPVNVWRPRPFQNSSPGGVGGAILDTFITFDATQGGTTPIDVRAGDPIVGGLGPPKATIRLRITYYVRPKYLSS